MSVFGISLWTEKVALSTVFYQLNYLGGLMHEDMYKAVLSDQSVKLHNAVTFQILLHVVTFENVTLCSNIALLQHNVTL